MLIYVRVRRFDYAKKPRKPFKTLDGDIYQVNDNSVHYEETEKNITREKIRTSS